MKMRYLVFLYTLFMLAVIGTMAVTYGGLTYSGRDMVYYNEQRKLVEAEWEKGTAPEKIEKEYGCMILLSNEEEYESRLNACIEENAVIYDYCVGDVLLGKLIWEDEKNIYENMQRSLFSRSSAIWLFVLFGGYFLLGLVYVYFIRPFERLDTFAAQIAKGNLDLPLPVRKGDFFGAFTESFDIMREELARAKESEYQANRSKKELVAELSHDIKTPVATIKAACEVMQLKECDEDTLNKVEIIAAKADTIDRLVGNLFHATMEELEVLKVEQVEESSLRAEEIIAGLKYYGDLHVEGGIPECLVYMDSLRLSQVIDNIVNNAYKYAGTVVNVDFSQSPEGIRIRIADRGAGVPEEELALLTEKFYRGSNAKGKSGSGLGLYLSKLFMQQMGGGLDCYNDDGFVVELFLKKV